MSARTKRFLKKLISYAGLFFFVIAAGMLYWQLRNYSLMDIARALWNIPFTNLVLASVACFFGYIALSLYDYLALDYVGRKVSWWKWMLAGMLGFAISNNAGHAVVSGGAIRYRLYTRWRVPGSDIIKMLTFSGFTFFLGYAAIVVIGYCLVPSDMFAQSAGASFGVNGLFIVCTSVLLAYYAISIAFKNKCIRIGEIKFSIPSFGLSIVQTFLGIMDALCAGLVLYFCIKPYIDMPFGIFIGIYVIAMVAGVFSQVPGGIGVFETVFMVALPDSVDKANIFGALLAYRIIYYVLVLIGVGGLLFIYERSLRARVKRGREEAIQKIPHIQMPHKKHKTMEEN
ncbi:MAG: lysylphosphatidylglycerol synthase domain-containing protein [Alphaproteobacteria bacterium]|nr:lysylphosphatidylglycerol synthase domain-containing protein [Alphaproteobacteria bacterium]